MNWRCNWTIRNDGNAPTPSSWTDRLYLSTTPELETDGNTLLGSWDNLNALNPGESYTREVTVTIPVSYSEGTVYLILLSNKNCLKNTQCPEGNTVFDNNNYPYCTSRLFSNNDFARFVELGEPSSLRHDNFLVLATQLVETLPDLHVVSLTHSDLVTGLDATINWTVRNDGNAPTPDGEAWLDKLYLSDSPTALVNEVILGRFTHSGVLASGESYSSTQTVSIPSTAGGDKYLILLSAQNTFYDVQCPDGSSTASWCTSRGASDGDFVERGEVASGRHDNFLVVAAHIELLLPELHIAACSHSILSTGRDCRLSFSVRNDGSRSTSNVAWTDRAYLSATPEIPFSGGDYTLLGSWDNVQPLDVGESYSRDVFVHIPNTIDPQQTYYLIVTADATYVYDVDCPAGTLMDANTSAPYCTAHSAYYTGSAASGQDVIPELSELGTTSNISNFHDWKQYLHDNFLIEPVSISLTSLPQLHALNLSASELVAGHETSVSWTIRNEGTAATPNGATWTDYVYLCVDTSSYDYWQYGDLLGSWTNLSALDPLQEYTRTVSVTIPQRSITGNLFLTVVSNPHPDNEIYGDQYPNVITIPVEVVLPQLPDLQVVNIVPGTTGFYSGTRVTVTATIKNAGIVPTSSNGWTDHLYISTWPVFHEDSVLLVATSHHTASATNPLLPDATYTVTFRGRVPLRVHGDVFFYVTTNADNNEFENINSANNTKRSKDSVHVYLTPPADLVVSSNNLSVSPANPSNREQIDVKYSVRNRGDGKPDTCYWVDKVYIASAPLLNDTLQGDPRDVTGRIYHDRIVDFDWNDNPVYHREWVNYDGTGEWYYQLGTALNKDSIGPGHSYTQTLSYTIPDFVPTGDYYIIVEADGSNAVFEYKKENNNLRALSFHYTRHEYNLAPTDFQMISPVVQGYAVQSSVTIANLGGLDFGGYLTLHLYCSTSPEPILNGEGIPQNATYLTSLTYNAYHDASFDNFFIPSALATIGGSLDDGNPPTKTVSTMLNFPTSIPDGNYYIYVILNRDHNFDESDYEDNIHVAGTFQLCHDCPLPDLAAENLVLPTSVTAGRTAQVEFDLRNNGTVDLNGGLFLTALHLSNDNGETWHWLHLSNDNDETWHWCPVFRQVAPLPVAHPTTPAGSYTHYLQHVTIPPNLPAGTYTARLSVDVSQAIQEANEEDNILVYSLPIVVEPYPLTITVVDDDSSPRISGISRQQALASGSPVISVPAEEVVSVSWNVELSGSNPAFTSLRDRTTYEPDGLLHQGKYIRDAQDAGYGEHLLWKQPLIDEGVWVDYLYFSLDDQLSPDDTPLEGAFISQRKASTSNYQASTNVIFPSSMQGDGYLILLADASSTSFEIDRTGDTLVRPIHIGPPVPPADLAITASEIPSDDDIKQGDCRIVQFTVTNIGEGTANGSWNDYIFDGDLSDLSHWVSQYGRMNLEIDYSRALAHQWHQGPLAPGESYTVQLEVTFPRDTPGPHNLTLWTSTANNGLRESSDNNNTLSIPYELHPAQPADLVAANVHSNSSPIIVGQPLIAEWTLSNIGQYPLSGTVRDGVYLSTDQVLDNDDYFLGQYSSYVQLDPSASVQRDTSFIVTGVPEGDYYLIVRANMPNAYYETSYTNNRTASSGTVVVTLPSLAIDVPEEFTLTTGQQKAYRLVIPAEYEGKTLQLSATTDRGDFAFNGLYCSFGDMPTTARHDFGTHMPYVALQDHLIPNLREGIYYILVTGTTADQSPQNITLLAHPVNFSILTMDASRGGNTGSISTKVRGAMFDTVMDFRLIRNENPSTDNPSGGASRTYYPAERVNFKDATESFVTFNLTDLPPGTYTVEGELPGGALTQLPDGFEIVDGLPGHLYYIIYAPDEARIDQNVEVTVVYGNTGSTDVEVAGFLVVSEHNHPIRRDRPFSQDEILQMQETNVFPTEATFEVTETGMDDEIIRPGFSGTMRFFIYANKSGDNDFIEFNIYPLRRK